LYGAYFIGAMLFFNSLMCSYEHNNLEYEYLLKSYFGFVIGGIIFFLMGIIVFPYRAFGILRRQVRFLILINFNNIINIIIFKLIVKYLLLFI